MRRLLLLLKVLLLLNVFLLQLLCLLLMLLLYLLILRFVHLLLLHPLVFFVLVLLKFLPVFVLLGAQLGLLLLILLVGLCIPGVRSFWAFGRRQFLGMNSCVRVRRARF